MKAIILRFTGKDEKKFYRLKMHKDRLAKQLGTIVTWEEFIVYLAFKKNLMTAQELLEDSDRLTERRRER